MKTAVATVLRTQRAHRALSSLRCLGRPVRPRSSDCWSSEAVPVTCRHAIAYPPVRSQSTTANPSGASSEPLETDSKPIETRSESDQTTVEPVQTDLSKGVRSAEPSNKEFPWQYSPALRPSQGDQDETNARRWHGKREAALPAPHPRLWNASGGTKDPGFTPRALTFARGKGFDAESPEEEADKEPIRPLTDRWYGSGVDRQRIDDERMKIESEARRAGTPSYALTFTCGKCLCASCHRVTHQAYHNGTVVISCPECKNKHLISDHLKIFSDDRVTLEDIIKRKGGNLKKGVLGADGTVEFY